MLSLSDRILANATDGFASGRKPPWLRMRLPGGTGYRRLSSIVRGHRLHTVCESARCPNLGECWDRGIATLMILGDVCTRSCGFCNVRTGRPVDYDTDEPRRVARSVERMGLRHVVITSVNRDELHDGGAAIWAETIERIRSACPDTRVEVLIPDFAGDVAALEQVLTRRPDVLNHNMETVRRLYPAVRPQARYERSLGVLRAAVAAGLTTKTGIMVGIGERDDEIEQLMRDVQAATRVDGHGGCDILTIGQYLQPTPAHLPVARWVAPERFEAFARLGRSLGFGHVQSGPLVRSSYHAEEQVRRL